MGIRSNVLLCCAFSTFFLEAAPAEAEFWVCNKTAGSVRVAAGWVDPGGGFTTQGWWTLRACGGCELLVLDDETADPYSYWYIAREVDGDGEWSGDSRRCTARSPFKITGNQQASDWCTDRGYTERYFKHVEGSGGDVTRNLTGGTTGRNCID